MGSTICFLVCGWNRFRPVRERQKGGANRRDPNQSQPALCTGDPSNFGNGCGGAGGCGAILALRVGQDVSRWARTHQHAAGSVRSGRDIRIALSGATVAVKHRLDLFGVLVLSFAGGNSGGIARDVIIGATPPEAISDWR